MVKISSSLTIKLSINKQKKNVEFSLSKESPTQADFKEKLVFIILLSQLLNYKKQKW